MQFKCLTNLKSFRFGVSGFPTIKFYSKTNKEGEAYNGGRDTESFIKYLNEKCGISRVAGGGKHWGQMLICCEGFVS